MKGSVRKAPGGGWVADITVGGRRKTAKCDTKKEAEARLREMRALLGQQPEAGGSLTLSRARELSLRVRWAGKAYERTASIYSQAALDHFGDVPLESITAPGVDRWREELQRVGNRPATVNRKVSALRAMLADAHLRGHLAAIPAMPQQLTLNNTRDRVLTAEEERRMCDAFHELGQPAAADLFVFLLNTAARFSEAAALRGEDIRIDRGGSVVRATARFRDTKNGSDRMIPLPTRAIDAIEPHLPAVPRHRVWGFTYWQLRDLFERAKQLAGLDEPGITIHTTRHTCATRLASGTRDKPPVPLHVLMWFGGWRSLAAVQRYAHRNTEAMAACVAVLEGQ